MASTLSATLAGTSLAALLAVSASARAEVDAPEDEIIVTGQYLQADQLTALRSPTPIIDVPQSLSIITADEIERRGFDAIGQIIDYTPGVNTSQGEGHRDAVVFRGSRSTADFFIDGVRDDVQYYRPLYNLEQVEILRGPNALLFGRGGTGGVLNRVTKKGVVGERSAGFQVGADTFGSTHVAADVNRPLGSRAALRVNALHESLQNHRAFSDGERWGVNPTLRAELGADTVLDVSYEFADHARFIDRGIPTGAEGRPVEGFRDIVFGDPQENYLDLTANLLRASVQHQFAGDLKANATVFFGDYSKLYSNFYVSDFDPSTPDRVTLDGYVDRTERQNLILSGNIVNGFDTGPLRHTLVAGVEYIDTDSDQNRFNAFWDTSQDDKEVFAVAAARPLQLAGGVGINAAGQRATNSFAADINDDTRVGLKVASAFIQDEIAVSERLDIVLGGRFDSFDIDVFDVVADERRTRVDERFSPRLGVVLKPRETVSLYGSFSETFLPRSGEQYANINGDRDALDPDTFTNLEGGVKWDAASGLSFTAALFEIRRNSPVVSDGDASRFDVIESTVNGVEAQVTGQITPDWYVSAGYSFLDGTQAGSDLRPRELPEHMLSLWNMWQVSERIGLGAGFTYQDESFANNANTAVLPDYIRFDAAAWWEVRDGLRLQLNVENLADADYYPNAHATHQVTVGAPLNARLSLSGRF